MALKSKHPSGPAMTLGNMRALGVQRLPTAVPSFRSRVVCAKWRVDRRGVGCDYWPRRRRPGPGGMLPLLAAPN